MIAETVRGQGSRVRSSKAWHDSRPVKSFRYGLVLEHLALAHFDLCFHRCRTWTVFREQPILQHTQLLNGAVSVWSSFRRAIITMRVKECRQHLRSHSLVLCMQCESKHIVPKVVGTSKNRSDKQLPAKQDASSTFHQPCIGHRRSSKSEHRVCSFRIPAVPPTVSPPRIYKRVSHILPSVCSLLPGHETRGV